MNAVSRMEIRMSHMQKTAYYHLPGLFEFYELYRIFLPLFREHREYFTTGVTSDPSMEHRRTASGERPRFTGGSRCRRSAGVVTGIQHLSPSDLQ